MRFFDELVNARMMSLDVNTTKYAARRMKKAEK